MVIHSRVGPAIRSTLVGSIPRIAHSDPAHDKLLGQLVGDLRSAVGPDRASAEWRFLHSPIVGTWDSTLHDTEGIDVDPTPPLEERIYAISQINLDRSTLSK